eukprot:TRINITY_DN25777_c0_g1_i1.p1 TRINITY_DN25777_c0_g1~~TRINITY_DN25777_c0_g1_i1.p1  ORF type:complete len:278 (+),score=29.44 TRINITY_DN25777_c0_g1_i1:83-916(+)
MKATAARCVLMGCLGAAFAEWTVPVNAKVTRELGGGNRKKKPESNPSESNPHGKIADLSKKVDAMEEELANGKIAALSKRVDDLEGELATLKSKRAPIRSYESFIMVKSSDLKLFSCDWPHACSVQASSEYNTRVLFYPRHRNWHAHIGQQPVYVWVTQELQQQDTPDYVRTLRSLGCTTSDCTLNSPRTWFHLNLFNSEDFLKERSCFTLSLAHDPTKFLKCDDSGCKVDANAEQATRFMALLPYNDYNPETLGSSCENDGEGAATTRRLTNEMTV